MSEQINRDDPKRWFIIQNNESGEESIVVFGNAGDQGETEFKYQKIKYKPVKGKSLIWPTDFTHTHRGIPSPTQEKWIATGWFITL